MPAGAVCLRSETRLRLQGDAAVSQALHGAAEPGPSEMIKILIHGERRLAESSAVSANDSVHLVRTSIEQVQDERIRTPHLDAKVRDGASRKVPGIEGYDHLRFRLDRRRQHVQVIWIGEGSAREMTLESLHERPGNGGVHEPACAVELVPREIGPVFQEIPDPFIVDRFRPSCANQPRTRQADQEVAKRRGIQDVCIIQRDDGPGAGHS